jgi:magnesium chelatase accessory protein
LQRLLDSTGSTLDAEGTELYRRLVASPDHAAGALGMMANWDLHAFARDLPRLAMPLLLMVGDQDRTVPPAQGAQVLQRLSHAAQGRCITLPGLGHLAHEDQPALVAGHIVEAFNSVQAERA